MSVGTRGSRPASTATPNRRSGASRRTDAGARQEPRPRHPAPRTAPAPRSPAEPTTPSRPPTPRLDLPAPHQHPARSRRHTGSGKVARCSTGWPRDRTLAGREAGIRRCPVRRVGLTTVRSAARARKIADIASALLGVLVRLDDPLKVASQPARWPSFRAVPQSGKMSEVVGIGALPRRDSE
jgi:hypothetical protein